MTMPSAGPASGDQLKLTSPVLLSDDALNPLVDVANTLQIRAEGSNIVLVRVQWFSHALRPSHHQGYQSAPASCRQDECNSRLSPLDVDRRQDLDQRHDARADGGNKFGIFGLRW